jgi:hypothetical protein
MAGSFEQINNRQDFQRELDRARVLCAKYLGELPGNPTLLVVDQQLEYFQTLMRAGRNPTRDERKSIDMGTRMIREFESGYDEDFYKFKKLISVLDLYIEFWPSDKLASDPNNHDKIDWFRA